MGKYTLNSGSVAGQRMNLNWKDGLNWTDNRSLKGTEKVQRTVKPPKATEKNNPEKKTQTDADGYEQYQDPKGAQGNTIKDSDVYDLNWGVWGMRICKDTGGDDSFDNPSRKAIVLEYLSIDSVDVQGVSRIIEHPVEDGTVVMDNRCKMPSKYTVHCSLYRRFEWKNADEWHEHIIQTRNLFLEMIQNKNLNNFFELYGPIIEDDQTTNGEKKGIQGVKKLQLETYSSKASQEKHDCFQFTLNFKEIMFSTNETTAASPENSSTQTA